MKNTLEQAAESQLDWLIHEVKGSGPLPDLEERILARLNHADSGSRTEAGTWQHDRQTRVLRPWIGAVVVLFAVGVVFVAAPKPLTDARESYPVDRHWGPGAVIQDPTSKKKKQGPVPSKNKDRWIKRRVFRNTDVHVALWAIAQQTRTRIVVSPKVAGTITLDIKNQTVRGAISALAAKAGLVFREGRKGVMHVEPTRKKKIRVIPVQFLANVDELPGSNFTRIVANASKNAVVISSSLKGHWANVRVRVRDKEGHALMTRAQSWAEIMEIGLEPSGMMVMERFSGTLVVISAQDKEPKAHVSLAFFRTDLRQIVARIAKQAGRTIRVDPRLDGKITVCMHGLSWRRALRAVAKSLDARVLYPYPGGSPDNESDEIVLASGPQ